MHQKAQSNGVLDYTLKFDQRVSEFAENGVATNANVSIRKNELGEVRFMKLDIVFKRV